MLGEQSKGKECRRSPDLNAKLWMMLGSDKPICNAPSQGLSGTIELRRSPVGIGTFVGQQMENSMPVIQRSGPCLNSAIKRSHLIMLDAAAHAPSRLHFEMVQYLLLARSSADVQTLSESGESSRLPGPGCTEDGSIHSCQNAEQIKRHWKAA